MIDIIIPVLNEEEVLTQRSTYFLNLKKFANIIFVDGGSKDKTVELAKEYGQVIVSIPGRGQQKNFGVQAAQSDTLLFLHVDTILDLKILPEIEAALQSGIQAGCFKLKVDDARLIFRLYEWVVDWRAKCFGVFDGDLGLFIRRDVFEAAGQFPDMAIMEDIAFSKRLRQFTKIKVLNSPIIVSSRKWEEQGFFRTLLNYTLVYFQFWTGIKCYRESLVEYQS